MSFFSSSSADSHLATAKTVLTTAASVAATAMLVRSVANEFLPGELRDYILGGIRSIFSRFSSELTIVIDEFEGLVNNQIYESAETYLGTKISPSTQRLKVSKPDAEKAFSVTVERDQTITDVFNGVKLNWVLICHHVETTNFHNPRDLNSTLKSEVRSMELTFHKKHKDMVLNTYLPFILKEAKSLKQEAKALRIFTLDQQNMYGNYSEAWLGINLDHPSTFDTLALDSETKEFVMEDLKRFVKRKEYYRKVGKAWKRGYLLYGPPGTGKSSLIAAMANYLHFDIYDLELTELNYNSELRRLLISTPNRSIVVVEDIDCTIQSQDRLAESGETSGNHERQQVTLSGLLNFIDGLWSSCGDERIIVFTTNHKDKLDPALLRPGRMDVHIHMSYCTPCGFRQLAAIYLGIKEHLLFGEIEEAIQETQVTPAEVAEQLLKSSDNIETTLKGLLDFLRKKKENKEEQQRKQKEDGDKKDDNDEKKIVIE
ncbi:AAA-ATPase At3g50940-like isoform X2 [Gastrolobium bilobum]|uniref:AAA-ATPase At3g50940-like isoform X2 n=1 Tax=Gastrolobium bilobum TaxID=150636 RepID=UPI002AB2919B|nr:AAA-ATPase At3g50940-like isoform X2 [Gastrolobium bilobum]